MDEENEVYSHNGTLFSHKKPYAICRKMDGTGDHHVKRSKPDSERKMLHVFCHMLNLDF
jgi:hypothetical protein